MAFKDHNCTCDGYCRCGDSAPCACEKMDVDPHCMYCCNHLTPGRERAWREDMAKLGVNLKNWKEECEDGSLFEWKRNEARNKNP